jgi:hypothetical protein
MGWIIKEQDFNSRQREESLPFLQHSDCFWGPLSLLSNSYQELFCKGKALGLEADHLPPPNAKVKNIGAIYLPLPYVFIV